jgi:hypothetical protein
MERRDMKKRLGAKGVDINGEFYIVSDYGYEDCGYQGPYNYRQVCKEWKAMVRRDVDDYDFRTGSGMHYITQDSWKLQQLDDRSRSEWR